MPRRKGNVLDYARPCATSRWLDLKRVLRWMPLVCGIVLFGVLAVRLSRENITRFYAFAGYSNAIQYFYDQERPIPEDIGEIEAAYNSWEHKRVTLPSPPYFLRPTFRPVESPEEGSYIVFIEPKPSGLHFPTRYIIITEVGDDYGSCGSRVDSVWEWELDDLIREDDRRRRTANDQEEKKL